MTTLPTTSSFRLPRTTGPGGPMVPSSAPSFGPGGPGGLSTALSAADVWRVIRANLWLIAASVLLAVAIGVGIYFYLLKNAPKYRSVAQMLVNKPFVINPKNTGGDDLGGQDFNLPIEQSTQTLQLTQEALWSDVLEKNTRLRETAWFKGYQAAADASGGATTATRMAKDDLAKNLNASIKSGTKLIELSMDAANPKDAHDIVEAIGNAHIANQQQATFDRTSQELESAKQWRDRYAKLASQSRDGMSRLMASSAAGASPAQMSRMNIKEMEMSQLIGLGTKARMEANEAAGMLDAVNQQIASGKDPYQVDLMVRTDPTVSRLTANVDDLELADQSETATGNGSKNAEALRARTAAFKAKLQNAEANARAIARNQIVDSSKSEFSSKKAEADSIDARIDALKTDLGEISASMAEYANLKDEYDGYKVQEREMTERVAVLQNAVRQQVASVNWSSLPTVPDSLSSPNLKLILPVAVMLGLALSLGVAFLRELADTSVRSPRDITRVGPMNVLGMVARESDDPETSGVPLHTVISTAPSSLLAEQLRQVRTRLQHAVSLDTTRTILVTSAGPGDGKTTIACNLAAGLALNGRRILLVDANFHRPNLHALYNVPNTAGFSNVLESVANLDTSVQKTPVTNLELLTTGPRAANQTELLESPLFNDFIDRALEEYDHVIFDAGPLLVVSEAVALAPRVDGVVTVVRAKKNTRGMLTRVRDTLKQIKAEHVGVVLNGVQTVGGGYYARNIKTYYDYQSER